jgi:hypothetical protein
MPTNRFTPAQVYKRFMAAESFAQISWAAREAGVITHSQMQGHWVADQMRCYLRARKRKGKK